ncbi:putative aetyltransferase YjgM [Leptolyngbya sp. BL0902]|uniref:GNAT family N-acetyltransferase n=1 Tax=Leptolyngbya sp. BL0902 TaxID=1115757 RepID=UPI0018E8429B|nr:GNAT family N-acetyltransferase [Leptolyngbya sp. BL0902]QQE66760.1 putative aetyltransferase YjgM [Leptolyngbya sp. BL0902]
MSHDSLIPDPSLVPSHSERSSGSEASDYPPVPDYQDQFRQYHIRSWQPLDRQAAGSVIATVLAEYGLGWEPEGSDRDALEVEAHYWQTGGEFWVVFDGETLVGTAGYYPAHRGEKAVEIRKMYLRPSARGQGLGRYLLRQLEARIQQRGFRHIWVETASVLKEAVQLYETSYYLPAEGVETARCDRIYQKTLT